MRNKTLPKKTKYTCIMHICFKMYTFQISLPQNTVFFSKKGTCHESERTGGDGNGPMVSLSSCDESTISAQRGLGATAGAAINRGHKGNGVSYDSYESWALGFLGRRVGKATPLVKARNGVPEQKFDQKTRWGLREIEVLKPKRFMTFLGGFRKLFLSGCNGHQKVDFFGSSLKCSIVQNGSKWPKKEGNMFFQTTLPWRNESSQTLHNGLLPWEIPVDMAHHQKHILRYHGPPKPTCLYKGFYVAKTLHFCVVSGGSWYKKLVLSSWPWENNDHTFSTCSYLEELKVVRMGITKWECSLHIHPSYLYFFYLFKFLPRKMIPIRKKK